MGRALEYYEQALLIAQDVGHRPGETATLNNIAEVYRGLEEPGRALQCYEQALLIAQQIGDRTGEAVIRVDIATLYRGLEQLDQAVAELERLVELAREVEHPDLRSIVEMFERVRREWAESDSEV